LGRPSPDLRVAGASVNSERRIDPQIVAPNMPKNANFAVKYRWPIEGADLAQHLL
jgi:hypothetical protein